MTLSFLIFQPYAWLIFGAILLALELFEGSFIFFLPTGLGAWITAGLIKLQLNGVLLPLVIFSDWSEVLLGYAIVSIIAIGLVRFITSSRKRRGASEQDDINKY